MQRVRSNTRLGTLIATTVPVTALGVVVGMGLGAPLLVCGPVALALGLGLGALLAAGIRLMPEQAHGGQVHSFGVRALLARAAHETRPALTDVDVRVDVAPTRLRTVGDPECLHRALTDLIVHAARRSPPGGMVTLAARSAPHGVRLEVRRRGQRRLRREPHAGAADRGPPRRRAARRARAAPRLSRGRRAARR